MGQLLSWKNSPIMSQITLTFGLYSTAPTTIGLSIDMSPFSEHNLHAQLESDGRLKRPHQWRLVQHLLPDASYLFFGGERCDVELDAHPFQTRMPAFTHDAEIGERIIQLTLDDSFDMVNLYSSLPRQSLEAVHDIGPNGS